MQEYRDETNGGKSYIIDIILKILEKEREELVNMDEEEVDSNTGAIEKAFKTLGDQNRVILTQKNYHAIGAQMSKILSKTGFLRL